QRLKAFVTVMEGCEKYCTFCVVPTTRGRERSHSPETVVDEIRGLAEAGCREVTLLGQTVNAYGRDLSPPTDLAALLERVNDIDGIERIRFTTSNPYNLTPRLIRAIRDVPKVCEYLHLPLQSGSDRMLERMNRGYTRARYLELIAELKATVPELALSTDLIVGFPGETEEDFARTVEMVEAVGHRFLDTYFRACSGLLRPDGVMLLQAITLRDQLYAQALRSVDFIQRFIFPGSFIPSIQALTSSIARASDLKVAHLEDIGPHYATTLRRWRENFFTHLDQVRALGYPERFIRMWEYYLCYCEGGFAERQLGDVHMLLVKPGARLLCR
ncbi:MAG: MiaB/RimO family radical SAM methylthiotransferase, partial [Gammaproteobacteria bacterium]|nr:MiaB/RimO family radical SAM methylthiotransferase [Gammaproteobacteria bacterium]